MELWVRSQDKEILIPIDKPLMYWESIDNIHTNSIVFKESPGYIITLGTYKTKERALEVLDEIQNILQPKYILDSSSIKPDGDSWAENGMIFQKYNANARVEELSTYVYKMPKD